MARRRNKPTYWDEDGPHPMHNVRDYVMVKVIVCPHCSNELWGELPPGKAVNAEALIKADDEIETTWQQWQCPCCGSWNDYPKRD